MSVLENRRHICTLGYRLVPYELRDLMYTSQETITLSNSPYVQSTKQGANNYTIYGLKVKEQQQLYFVWVLCTSSSRISISFFISAMTSNVF